MPSFILPRSQNKLQPEVFVSKAIGILPPIGPNLLCDRDEKELPSRLPV